MMSASRDRRGPEPSQPREQERQNRMLEPQKRRRLLIDGDFQFRFMGRIFLMTLCCSLLTLTVLFAGGLLSPRSLGFQALLALILPSLLFILYSLALSHRLAGPLYRLRRILKEMTDGNLRGAIAPLRRKDELKPVLEDIRRLRERWRGDLLELRSLVNYLEEMDSAHLSREHLQRIKELLGRYKLK